jgi:hypothetical protein
MHVHQLMPRRKNTSTAKLVKHELKFEASETIKEKAKRGSVGGEFRDQLLRWLRHIKS